MQCCPRSLGAMSLCPPSIQKIEASPSTKHPEADNTPPPFTGVFPHPWEAPESSVLLLGLLGVLCIFTFVCFATTVSRPYLCSQVKMSWDTKLPEASFPSVLILLHTAPWLCFPHSFNLCLLIKLVCFSLRHGIPYPDSMEAQKPELPGAWWFPLSDFFLKAGLRFKPHFRFTKTSWGMDVSLALSHRNSI